MGSLKYKVGDILRHKLMESYIEVIQYIGSDNYVVRRVEIDVKLSASHAQLSQNWQLLSSLEKELL